MSALTEKTYSPIEVEAGNAAIMRVASMDFDGDSIIKDLRKNPLVALRGIEIDFNSNVWDFSALTSDSPASPGLVKARFNGKEGDDAWKLFLLCRLTWKSTKVVTNVERYRAAARAFQLCGGTDARQSRIRLEGYRRFLESLSPASWSRMQVLVTALQEFLVFRRTFFHVPIDPDLEEDIQRLRNVCHGQPAKTSAPLIDDTYLIPLIQTCKRILEDDKGNVQEKDYAASILIISQTGIRISEFFGLEAGRVRISHLAGKEDIAYLEYTIFKGGTGDRSHKPHITVLNETALIGYRWLEESCERRRGELGIDTLFVLPRQKRRFASPSTFVRGYQLLLMAHHDEIPCINTQERYPELQRANISELHQFRRLNLAKFGIDGTETLVYPRIHSFRVTVATKHCERGDDLHYISKRLGHATEAMTASYIQSDKRLNEANNDLVYRTVLGDGAEFIGPRGKEFQQTIERFVQELPDHVKANLDEVVAATSKAYPLRRKVGGVCIRCGWVKGCTKNDETDQIYCAFGVCPNQCVLYFMADQCLGMVRSHVELIKINVGRGHIKAARNELRKAQNVIQNSLVPELDSLEQQLGAHGRDGVLGRFPELEEIVDNLPEVRKKVAEWMAMSI